MRNDFSLQNEGSVFILYPLTSDASAWCDEHLPDDAPMWGKGYAIGHRYIEPIVQAIVVDGMEIGA